MHNIIYNYVYLCIDVSCIMMSNIVYIDVCYSVNRNLTGMAIADITLLSGFEVKAADLDRVSKPHYCSTVNITELSLAKCTDMLFNSLKIPPSYTFHIMKSLLEESSCTLTR